MDTERIARIEEVVCRIERRLFGNGQPGELRLLDDRVSRLEQFRWQAAGVVAVLLLALSVWAGTK